VAAFSDNDLAQQRERLVARIRREGIRDTRVLDALNTVPREAFVPPAMRGLAYRDSPLPIGHEQTISQPYIVALMAEALNLQSADRVLEIGTGSGYAAAVLAAIAKEVYTIECHRDLAESAGERLRAAGVTNAHVLHADGTRGWPEHAPFDAITVAAGGPETPPRLLEQLRVGGRLVIPVGRSSQQLIRVTRVAEEEFQQDKLAEVRFVPLTGAGGWNGDDLR
jgi:protein-L-isoaspartate(D-aspartate) O-methyltransferase